MFNLLDIIKRKKNSMILSFNQFINERYSDDDLSLLNQYMNKRKVKHSCKVAELTTALTSSEDVYNAALYHDYVERGGTLEELKKVVTPYSYALIMALTKTETDYEEASGKNVTLDVLKSKLLVIPEHMRHDLIIIKIADRTDNLRKRLKAGDLSKHYLRKSAELIQFLFNAYTGSDKKKVRKFIDKHIIEKFPKIRKRVEFNAPNGLYEKVKKESNMFEYAA